MANYKHLTDEEVQKINERANKEYQEQAVFILSCLMPHDFILEKQREIVQEIAKLYRASQRYSFDIRKEYDGLEKILKSNDPLPALKQHVTNCCIDADIFKRELSETVRRGIGLRKNINPQYPDIFKDKSTHYLEIKPILTTKDILTKVETDFKNALPETKSFTTNTEDLTFLYQGQTFRSGRFLFQRCNNISLLRHEIATDPAYISDYIQFFEESDFEGFKSFRSVDKERKSQFFALRNDVDFYLFASFYREVMKDGCSPTAGVQKAAETIETTYKPLLNDIQHTADHHLQYIPTESEKDQEDLANFAVDMIIISNNPSMIARKSTYVWWQNHIGPNGEKTETCMAADGENHNKYVPRSIGSGSLIAVGVNKCCPDRWLCRMDIEPYINPTTKEVLYQPGRLYGQQSTEFYQHVKAFCNTINKGKEGFFRLRKGLYKDCGLPTYWQKCGKEEHSY